MTTLHAILVVGFLLGVRHAADADHVIAVSTIVARGQRTAAAMLVGALWGIGHTITIFAVGTAIILFNARISPKLGLSMEVSVGVMLILLGLSNLTGPTQWTAALTHLAGSGGGRLRPRSEGTGETPVATSSQHFHAHPHAHGDYVHSHPHGHRIGAHGHRDDETPVSRMDRMFGTIGVYRAIRSVLIGVVHGLAGSAAIVLMILATIREPVWALGYLAVFGVGTIGGMMAITFALSLPLAFAGRRFDRLERFLTRSTGVLSLAVGLSIASRAC